MTLPQDGPDDATPRLVVVTGSGRSGTSTVAGTLKMLGLGIPQPEVKANDTNPRGFFEPRWVVDFHKRLLAESGVATLDARPAAVQKAARRATRPEARKQLHDWLRGAVEPQFVVKDPRTFWLHQLWHETAEDLGIDMSMLTMLRHPAEVVGSRDAYYTANQSVEQRKFRETGLVAGWVNVALANERASRADKRVFVHYENLLSDWRTEMVRVRDAFGLDVNTDLEGRERHEVDDFIDVSLHRVKLTWDDLSIPDQLRDLADRVWQCLSELADDGADHGAASTRMDGLRVEYDTMYEYSRALVHDATKARIKTARQNARREAEAELTPTSLRALPRRAAGKARRWVAAKARR
ncbi:MAG: sulfotransferase family protein [Nocardioidaceae bacterium]|nr:sulfotransferase family protein [Nocardioidaceae bacterium]NUS51529.1 sulfotransferase family protein [Nocardioidaceae bacterium]